MTPDLTITLFTYASNADRATYAHRTIRALAQHLVYPGRVNLCVCDDGSPGDHALAVCQTIEQAEWLGTTLGSIMSTNADRGGYGANYNMGLAHAQDAAVYLPLEDDWELLRSFDADPHVQALLRWNDRAFAPYETEIGEEYVGCIRLGYLGWTGQFRGKVVRPPAGGQSYLLLDPASPERHVFSGHPRLEHARWRARLGRWPEGLNPGATEFEVCAMEPSRHGVAWPLDVTPTHGSLFGHFGAVTSRSDEGR